MTAVTSYHVWWLRTHTYSLMVPEVRNVKSVSWVKIKQATLPQEAVGGNSFPCLFQHPLACETFPSSVQPTTLSKFYTCNLYESHITQTRWISNSNSHQLNSKCPRPLNHHNLKGNMTQNLEQKEQSQLIEVRIYYFCDFYNSSRTCPLHFDF